MVVRPNFRSKTISLITLITLTLGSLGTNIQAQNYPRTPAIKIPAKLAKDHPELFDEIKFEKIYAKWSKRLDHEFKEILSTEKLTWDENGELLKTYIQAAAQAYFTEDKTKLDPKFALSAKTELVIRDWLNQYGVTVQTAQCEHDTLLFELKKTANHSLFHEFKNLFKSNYEIAKLVADNNHHLGAFTLCKVTKNGHCQHLMGIANIPSQSQLSHNYLDGNMLSCIVGHEGVHMLYHDNLYAAIYAENTKLNKFQEKRADILAVLSCSCPLNSAVYWFSTTPKDGLYSHRASPEWLALIHEIASCYQPQALVTVQKNNLSLPCAVLVHELKPLLRGVQLC